MASPQVNPPQRDPQLSEAANQPPPKLREAREAHKSHKTHEAEPAATVQLDCRGLRCPEPVQMLRSAVRMSAPCTLIELLSDDPVSRRDVPAFCRFLGHTLLESPTPEHPERFLIRTGS